MKNSTQTLILFGMVLVLISVVVLGTSMTLLPDAPYAPTPTQPKAIDFPDARPVPAR